MSNAHNVIESVITWLLVIANSPTHGYSQTNRNGPDYDCSSLIIEAFNRQGVPVKKNGAVNTFNMLEAFLKSGFKKVLISDRQRGDVLLNTKHHTALYIGDNTIIHASRDYDGKTGDSTGKEICTRPYYNYPWEYCLRYVGLEHINEPCSISSNVIKYGSTGDTVKVMQYLLNYWIISAPLNVDGDCGPATTAKIRDFQSKMGLVVDGECGSKTWGKLING